MRALTATDLLRTSEALQNQSPLEQALTILQAALPELDREELADLTVSDRDTRLLELREQTLGAELEGCADCTRCATTLEFLVRTTDVASRGATRTGRHCLEENNLRLHLRMPTSRDLFNVVNLPPAEGRRALAQGCIVSIERGVEIVSLDALPDDLIESAARQLCQDEPTAESLVTLNCPSCGHRWQVILDIGSFFAKEIEALARRLLWEVHVLATAYGWTEHEVLTLSARRRHAYLELVGYE